VVVDVPLLILRYSLFSYAVAANANPGMKLGLCGIIIGYVAEVFALLRFCLAVLLEFTSVLNH
jgi:hypothetical protein